MANIDLYKQKLVAIANAIRSKLGGSGKYTLEEMPGAIASIPTGGTDTSDATLSSSSQMLSPYTAYSKGVKYTGSISQRSAASESISSAKSYQAGYYPSGWTVTPLGIDTSDATATANDVISGKTAYAKGSKITGNITSKAAQSYTPGVTNQVISSGQYLSGDQTILGDSDLKASNIKSGANIFGVVGTFSGTDTSDANATASDILSGKTAYVRGSKITGNILSKSAQVYTPGTEEQVISSGQYLSGNQTIIGDSDLKPSNIRQGVNIFGVNGSYSGIDTSDATLTSGSQMLSSYTAYSNGVKYTGSIPTRSASSETISSPKSYQAGYYSAGWTVTPMDEEGLVIVDGYTNKDDGFCKDFSLSTVSTFNDIVIANGYEPLSLTRS